MTLPPDELIVIVGLSGLGEEETTGVNVGEDESQGDEVAPGMLNLAERDKVKVRSGEVELDAVKREFVEDTVGEDVRVTDTAAVLVTLDDEDTDGERVFDMDIEGEGLSEGSKDDVNPGEELPDPLSKAVLEGVA